MPVFSYQGRDQRGEAVSGRLQAGNAAQLARLLSERDITPIRIEPVVESSTSSRDIHLNDLPIFQQVSLDELILFSRQMYSLSKAGVPITQAIRGLALSIGNRLLSQTLDAVANQLEQGMSLSSCLHRHPKVFSPLYVSVIHVGENSGQLDAAFQRIGEYLELERDTVRNLKSATRYPLFVIIAIGIAMTIINLFVLPNFADIFSRLNAELPAVTQLLFAISGFVRGYWLFILLTLVGAYVGWRAYKNSDAGGLQWDQFKLGLPIVGKLFNRIILGRFSRMLSLALKSGVPIVQSLSIIADAVGNRFIASHVRSMQAGIERGETLTQAAQQTGMFTPLVLQMLAVGEETGQVDEMLEQTADFYDQEVAYDLKRLASSIEPILIVAIAGMVLVLALGVFLPLWELSGAVNR